MGKGTSGSVTPSTPQIVQPPVNDNSILPEFRGTAENLGQAGTGIAGQAAQLSQTPFAQLLPQQNFGSVQMPMALAALLQQGQQSPTFPGHGTSGQQAFPNIFAPSGWNPFTPPSSPPTQGGILTPPASGAPPPAAGAPPAAPSHPTASPPQQHHQ